MTSFPGIFSVEACFFIILAILSFLFWKLISFSSEISQKYDNLEKLLFDIRDGTNAFHKERRKGIRLEDEIYAKISGKEENCKVINIGEGGILLRTSAELEIGASADLKIFIPIFPQPIDIKTKVVRVNSVSGTNTMSFDVGMEFLGLNQNDKKKIAEWLGIVKNNRGGQR